MLLWDIVFAFLDASIGCKVLRDWDPGAVWEWGWGLRGILHLSVVHGHGMLCIVGVGIVWLEGRARQRNFVWSRRDGESADGNSGYLGIYMDEITRNQEDKKGKRKNGWQSSIRTTYAASLPSSHPISTIYLEASLHSSKEEEKKTWNKASIHRTKIPTYVHASAESRKNLSINKPSSNKKAIYTHMAHAQRNGRSRRSKNDNTLRLKTKERKKRVLQTHVSGWLCPTYEVLLHWTLYLITFFCLLDSCDALLVCGYPRAERASLRTSAG